MMMGLVDLVRQPQRNTHRRLLVLFRFIELDPENETGG
jgi:hypothetical protein